MVTRAEAATELLRRREARRSLLSFIRYINPDYIVSDFSIQVCAELERFLADCLAGLRPLLILEAPPQHGKSDMVSRYLPAFIFGHYPDLRLAGLSYAKDLASDMNRDVQAIMSSPEYRALFPKSALGQGNGTANGDKFDVPNSTGAYVGQGVGGPLTGKRVDCLVAGTQVLTSIGNVNIEDLPMYAASCKIVTHNGTELQHGNLKAFASRQGLGIYRITTKSGRVFEATGCHRVHTGRGYVEAAQLAEGDVLLCSVQQADDTNGSGLRQDAKGWRKRWNLLLDQVRSQRYAEVKAEVLRNMRGAVPGAWSKVLLKGLYSSKGIKVQRDREDVRDVHVQVHDNERAIQGAQVLQPDLFRQESRAGDDGREQSKVFGWSQPIADAATFCKGIPQDSPSGFGAGQLRVRAVQEGELQAGSPPHGWMGEQQCVVEFGDDVCKVPQRSPQANGLGTVRDYVASVERVRESATVYDIEVDGNHNFFANGVLVHNCGIIDDPIKNSKEALSSTVKESIWKWYGSTFLTRLSKNSGHIIMATRWATDDLSGRVLAANPKARRLSFPAINEKGEPLVPDLHPLEKLLETKQALGDYFWSAMYQGSPKTLGGAIFKDSGVRYYLPKDLPTKFDKVIQSWDMTFKDSEGSDYVAGQVWAKAGANTYLLHEVRERMGFTASKQAVKNMTARYPDARRKLIEDKANGPAILDSLKAEISGMVAIEPDGSKIARAHACTAEWEAGNVWLPHPDIAPWVREFVEEVTTFPAAANDDRVDAMSQALRDLYAKKGSTFG